MIGLFLGSTDFPKLILNKIKNNNKKYFIIDLTINNEFKKDKNTYFFSIGQFGKILSIIKENLLVNEVLEFINKDKKRPICTPYLK